MDKQLKICILIATVTTGLLCQSSRASEAMLKTEDINIRDPFIYADPETKTYYMYTSMHRGVGVYTSTNLTTWSGRQRVLNLSDNDYSSIKAVWAPEMHRYNWKYYLLVTLTDQKLLKNPKPVNSPNWPDMHIRGTHIFYADSPTGPFKPFKKTSYTPENWMALDGTFFEENGTPYMVFCHEWVQTVDGTMNCIQLKDDLSDTIGDPELLFKASEVPKADQRNNVGKITDGCFLYRSPSSKKLFMIWSTFIPGHKYCVISTQSESGSVKGPWGQQELLYTNNGGHGMIFRTFDNQLLLALHQPNKSPAERLHLFELSDTGQELKLSDGFTPQD